MSGPVSDAYTGEIRIFAGNFAPSGWLICNGQLLPIAQYTALFSLLGTTYGGDGKSTFALPNFQGIAPMHWGNGPGLTPRSLGETGGSTSVTLTQSQLPAHSHPANASLSTASELSPSGNLLGDTTLYSDPPLTTAMSAGSVQPVGGNTPHDNMQPSLAFTFIIAFWANFPPRV